MWSGEVGRAGCKGTAGRTGYVALVPAPVGAGANDERKERRQGDSHTEHSNPPTNHNYLQREGRRVPRTEAVPNKTPSRGELHPPTELDESMKTVRPAVPRTGRVSDP